VIAWFKAIIVEYQPVPVPGQLIISECDLSKALPVEQVQARYVGTRMVPSHSLHQLNMDSLHLCPVHWPQNLLAQQGFRQASHGTLKCVDASLGFHRAGHHTGGGLFAA
jgi:hypothetical protein